MRVVLLGSIFGEIDRIYDNLDRAYNGRIDWVLSTGNFGIWPDPLRADKPSRKQPGDFLDYLVGKKNLPFPTLMVAGKHEDHLWLDRKVKIGEGELIYNLHFLVSGNHTFIEDINSHIKIVGIGGTYSPEPKRGNYKTADIQKACASGPMDIVLSHEAPDRVQLGRFVSTAKGINKVCFATQPKLIVSGKINYQAPYTANQTHTPGLNISHRNFTMIEIDNDGYSIV